MVLRLLVWGLILKNMPQPLPKAVQVSFMERLWMSSKMLMVKLWKPSLSQLVWTTQGLVLSTVISTKFGRATYDSITDEEALEGFKLLSRLEGIIPALESSHAIALAQKVAAKMSPDQSLIVCLSVVGTRRYAG